MIEHYAFCGGNDWTEIDSKKRTALSAEQINFFRRRYQRRQRKQILKKNPSFESHNDTDNDSNGDQ